MRRRMARKRIFTAGQRWALFFCLASAFPAVFVFALLRMALWRCPMLAWVVGIIGGVLMWVIVMVVLCSVWVSGENNNDY